MLISNLNLPLFIYSRCLLFYSAHARKAMFALPTIVVDCVYIVGLFALLCAGVALVIYSGSASRTDVRGIMCILRY